METWVQKTKEFSIYTIENHNMSYCTFSQILKFKFWEKWVTDGLIDRWTNNHEIIIGGHIEAVDSIEVEKIWSYKAYKWEILVQTQLGYVVSEEVEKNWALQIFLYSQIFQPLENNLVGRENNLVGREKPKISRVGRFPAPVQPH